MWTTSVGTLYHLMSYTPIFKITECLTYHKDTILVDMILNGKGSINDCVVHGYSFISILFPNIIDVGF